MKLKLIRKPLPELNMIPMIDVILMLLIFFLVATQMKREESSIDLVLPESVKALIDAIDKSAPTPLMVNILPKSEGGDPYIVGGVRMGNEGLALSLQAQARKQVETGGGQASVRIRCDKSAEFIQLQNAIRACQTAQIVKVYIAAEHRE